MSGPADRFPVAGSSLTVGGVELGRLAERVGGTPFFAYDRALMDERVASLRTALPKDVEVGDLVAIFQAGAYGLTASPTAFLGHPAAAEILV